MTRLSKLKRLHRLKTSLILLLLSLLATTSSAQVLMRLNNETASEFTGRVKPDSSEIAHPAIETRLWNGSGKIIVVFYSESVKYSYEASSDTLTGQQIFGYVLIEKKKQVYQKILIDSFDLDTKIESIFFANADRGVDKELCVLTSNRPPPEYCKCDGVNYSTRIYRKPDSKKSRLSYLRGISAHFVEFEGWARGDQEEEKAKFKNARAIKKELARLGYRQ